MAEDLALIKFIDEGSLDGMWLWDLKNPEEEWLSPRFWQLLGYNPAEMPHKASSWKEIIFPEDLELAIRNFEEAVKEPEKNLYDQEVRYRHKNGSVVHVRCRGKIILDTNGEPVLMLGAHNDITALKQAQYETQRQKDFYQSIVENQSIFVIKTDLEGCYTYGNELFQKTFFDKDEEFIGRSSLENIIPEDHQRCIEIVQKCIEDTHQPQKVILHKYDRSGEIHANEWEFKALVDADGTPREISCIGVRITDLINANKRLEGLLELYANYNDRLRKHSYITSHNVRSSVANLLAIAEVLEKDPGNERFLEMLSETTKNLDQTLRNLNDLLNRDAGHERTFAKSSVSVKETIDRILTIHRSNIEKHSINVNIELEDQLNVEAVPAYFESICENLISNVLKYGCSGTSKDFYIKGYNNNDMVTIEVIDHGQGLDTDQFQSIFEMGHRASSKGNGQGVGLFISRQQAEMMGGSLTVKSTQGRGCTFILQLKREVK